MDPLKRNLACMCPYTNFLSDGRVGGSLSVVPEVMVGEPLNVGSAERWVEKQVSCLT